MDQYIFVTSERRLSTLVLLGFGFLAAITFFWSRLTGEFSFPKVLGVGGKHEMEKRTESFFPLYCVFLCLFPSSVGYMGMYEAILSRIRIQDKFFESLTDSMLTNAHRLALPSCCVARCHVKR